MRIAICIVSFRNPQDIVRCLGALALSTHTNFEVVICENGGAEAFEVLRGAISEQLPGGQPVTAVLAPGNLGYAGGVNLCLRATPAADAWWILNPDTLADPEAMALQIARLEVGDCDAVGSTIYLENGRVQSHGGRWRAWLARAESIGHGSPLADPAEPTVIEGAQNYLNGASMMIGRRFLEVAGPMREEYFLYCEEVEWCLRGVQLGLRLGFAPGARVLHYAGTTTGSYADIRERPRTPVYLNERNKMLTTRDRFPFRLPVAALASLILIFMRFGRQRAWKQVGYGIAGWFAGLRNVRGVPIWLED
jgi:GT2 family glycosyltransferase